MQEEGVDPSQYASSEVVATSHPRELGSTGPDLASKLGAKATKQALNTPTPASNGIKPESNGVKAHSNGVAH